MNLVLSSTVDQYKQSLLYYGLAAYVGRICQWDSNVCQTMATPSTPLMNVGVGDLLRSLSNALYAILDRSQVTDAEKEFYTSRTLL